MQQHVQLLVQTCILDSSGSNNFTQSVQYLNELGHFRSESPNPQQSLFKVSYLPEAKQIIEIVQSKKSPENLVSVGKQMNIISCSPVFMYRELLPRYEKDGDENKFSVYEDCLIVYGLSQMSGYFPSAAELISTYLMPVHSPNEINARIRTIRQSKTYSSVNNPINQYKMFGNLPPYCKKVADVYPGDVKRPIDMEGKLPDWLQKMKDALKTINKNCKNSDDMSSIEKLTTPAKNVKKTSKGRVKTVWTREMDGKVLHICKKHGGLTGEALSDLSKEFLFLSKVELKSRFHELMEIYRSNIIKKRKRAKN